MKILFFGDSITDMGRCREAPNGDISSYGSGYVFVAASELHGENPLKYEVVNRGISGNRVVDLYARIKSDVWNESPDVLSILIGVNDVWHEIGSGNGVDLERWERVYRMLIEDTLKRLPKLEIVICEPFVLSGNATKEIMKEFEQVYDYAAVAKKIASDYKLHFLPLQKKLDEAAKKHGVEAYLFDGVHPAIGGAKLIATEWLNLFKKEIDN